MKICKLTLLLLLLFTSCGQERDVQKLRQVFAQTTYDQDVINNLALYDSLKDIIILNIDTLFKFRNSRHFVDHAGVNGYEVKVQEDQSFYEFYRDYGSATALSYGTGPNDQKLIDDVNLENMPAFIYPAVDKIFRKLGKRKILGFTLWRDSTIEISVKARSRGRIDEGHVLTWKRIFAKNTDPEFFSRDTLVAPKWTYRIQVDEHRGW